MEESGKSYSAIYQMRLNGPVPERLLAAPQMTATSWLGQAESILENQWRFGHQRMICDKRAEIWTQSLPSKHFANRLHRFLWLPELVAHSHEGLGCAIAHLNAWLVHYGKWNSVVWQADVTADRLFSWLVSGLDCLAPGGTADPRLLESMARQYRHLSQSAEDIIRGDDRLRAYATIAMSTICLSGEGKALGNALDKLKSECEAQILADGGHISRSPEAALNAYVSLHALDELLLRTGRPVPEFLDKTRDLIARMLKFLSEPQSSLPSLNGGARIDTKHLAIASGVEGAEAKAFALAPRSGFQKITLGDASLMMDFGSAPPEKQSVAAHSGCLAIEYCHAGESIITSCGSHRDLPPEFSDHLRNTAAHSTLSVSNSQIGQFYEQAEGISTLQGPEDTYAKRMEMNGQIWIEAQHDGWRDRFDLLHRRRAFLDGDGSRIMGEDALFRPASAAYEGMKSGIIPFEIFFHLAAGIEISEDDLGARKLIFKVPSGAIWGFTSSVTSGEIIESVQAQPNGRVFKTPTIRLVGHAKADGDGSEDSNLVKWSFKKLG